MSDLTEQFEDLRCNGSGMPQDASRRQVVDRALQQIGQTILESMDLRAMMDCILEKILDVGGFDIGMIRLFNSRTHALDPVSSRGYRDPANVERQRKQVTDAAFPRITGQVMARMETKVEDLAEVDGMRTFRSEGVRTIVTVPLRAHDEALGVIHIGYRYHKEVDPEEIRLLEAVGTQTGIAAQKFRLLERAEQQAKEQATLNAIAEATSRSLELKELFEITADKVVEVTGRQRINFRLKDASTGHILVVAHRGFSEEEIEQLRRKVSHPMLDRVFASGESVIINGRSENNVSQLLRKTQSVAWIPLKVGTTVVGALGISDDQSAPFAPSEVSLLQAIGNVIGVAIQNARLFGQMRNNLEQIRALHQIATELTSTLDLQRTLDLLLEKIDRVLPSSAANVRLLDPDSGYLAPAACRNLDEAAWKASVSASRSGLSRSVFESKRIVVIQRLEADPRVRDTRLVRQERLVSFLGVPLIVRDQTLGVLSFYTREQRDFSTEQIEFISALASQAAMAIHNSQLYEQTRHQAVDLEQSNRAKDDLVHALEQQKQELSRLNAGLQSEVAERTKARAEIAAKNRDLETLLYVTSHDLREPLRAIENFSRIINDRYSAVLDDKGRDFLRRVILGAQRLNRLLDDILTLSRSQRIQVPTREVNAGAVIDEALKRLEDKIKMTGARVHVAPGFDTLPADSIWATQAVYNLIANALKFTRNGDVPEIEIAPYRDNSAPDLVGIAVRDRGPGVAAEHMERIFQLFQRAVGREVEGTGAGLAIVRQIAERHGGSAWVEPRAGGGSEFIITFSRDKLLNGGTAS